jgi:hypothetical protein
MTNGEGGARRARSGVWLSATAVLLLVFVAGAAAGWAGARKVCRPPRGRDAARSAPPAWLCGRRPDRDPMARLKLSAAERARVDSVVKSRQGQIRAFWEGPGRELRVILDSMHSDVRNAIAPEHRAAFDSLPRPGSGGRRGGGSS